MSGVWLIILMVAVVLVTLDSAFISWWYVLPDRPERIDVATPDGWTVVAWYRPAVKRRFDVPVVLCHGLANNHAFMEFRGQQNLAKFLSELGFDCYSLDLRGAGSATAPDEGPWDASFDDHVQLDLPALVNEVSRRSGSQRVVWVGHSLGGVVALAAASTTLKDRFAALITIGSPVFFRLHPRLKWLMRLGRALAPWGQFNAMMLRVVAPFAGRTPAPKIAHHTANLNNLDGLSQRYLVANVFAPIWKGVLRQLEDWLLHDAFRSVDGVTDYRAGVPGLTSPTLIIGGTVDHLAPPEITRELFALVTAPVRQLALFGAQFGHSADYGHGDLVVGKNAHLEVYPVIQKFLEQHLQATTAPLI